MKKYLLLIFTFLFSVSLVFGQLGADLNANTGPPHYGTALGNDNDAAGQYAFIGGSNSFATGSHSFGFGLNVSSVADYSFAFGHDVTSSGVGSFALGQNVTSTGINSWVIGSGGIGMAGVLTNGTDNSLMIGFNTSTPSLFIKQFDRESPGYIGVFTTSPTSELDVNGTITTTGFKLTTNHIAGHVLTAMTDGTAAWMSPSTGSIGGGGTISDSPWDLNGSNIFYNTGNVGIGTTNAQEMLHVTGKILTEDGLSMQSLSNKIIFGNDANSTFSIMRSTYSKNVPTVDEILTIDVNNNVGIGTNNPGAELEVAGKTKTSQFQLNSDGNSSGFVLMDTDGNGNSEWVDPLTITSSGVWSEANNEAYYLGNVGIGTSNPEEALHIEFGEGKAGILFKSEDETYTHNYPIEFKTGVNGTHGTLTNYIPNFGGDYYWTCKSDISNDPPIEGMRLEVSPWGTQGRLSINGKINTKSFQLASESNVDGFILQSDADGDAIWVDPVVAGVSSWTQKSNSNDIYRMSGNIGIGTSATDAAKLSVRGKIIAMSMDITEDVPASDYVFEADYPLMPLNELESYVNKNKHLPEVKSAKEFKEEGYNIGKMDDVLLRKIEELTLYVIEQQKMIDELRKDLKEKTID